LLDVDAAASTLGVEAGRLRSAVALLAGQDRVDVSVVLPVYNEADNLVALVDRIASAAASIGTYEIVIVDDGSTDGSRELVGDFARRGLPVRGVLLSRNFGHQSALLAGMRHADGRAVVLMDADGQDPPELLATLVDRWRGGADVVYAVRRARKETAWKRAGYRVFYATLARLAEVSIPMDAGDFCLMDRRVVDVLASLPESSQFLRGLRSWVGFRQDAIEYDRPAREAGVAKYTLGKLVRLALDGIVSFSSLPLRLASILGFTSSVLGLLYLLYAVSWRLFVGHVPAGWTSLIAIVLLASGAQLIVTGVLGEYLARVYAETKRRPQYVVERVVS
jgi:dolichol-phosphate mannosyltransferase